MVSEFKLPELGENISAADILKVTVSEGDKVEVDQIILEIETDKATIEVPSDISGTVKKVHVKEGQKAKVGDVILTLETNGAQASAPVKTAKKEEPKAATPKEEPKQEVKKEAPKKSAVASGAVVEFKLPDLGENIASADVIKVNVAAGDKVEVDQTVLELETDKATVEVPSDVSGIVKEVKIKDGDKVKTGQVILVVQSSGGEVGKEEKQPEPAAKPVKSAEPVVRTSGTSSEPVVEKPFEKEEIESMVQKRNMPERIAPASPSVRRFAREIGIDIHQVSGSGEGGRITIDDVKAFAKSLNEKISKGGVAGGLAIAGEPLPDFSKWGDVERKPMSNVRRKTAEHLSYAWATVPQVTQYDKADITELENLRKQFGKKAEAAGGKLTVTAVLLKIIASALKVFPQFNTSVDMNRNEVVYKNYFNIGVAVDTDRGLLVPVIRDVDKKNIIQLAVELNEVSKKARDKKLSLEDMQGGSFTISNLGGIGGTYFSPIVNSPEVAILGVSRGSYEPVYIDGKFEPRLMLPLSLSYDHRIIDGADGARFLKWVANAVEQPFLLSLEG